MAKRNRVLRISLSGGLIGLFTTNPRKALEDSIDKANQEGWHATQIQPHRTTNLLIVLLQILVLFVTVGLWTWGSGYMILLERDNA
jgi:hypothetical protein